MKYLLLIYNNRDASEAWLALPPEQQQASMDLYWGLDASLKESGEFISSEPLQGAETATVVRVRDVVDGERPDRAPRGRVRLVRDHVGPAVHVRVEAARQHDPHVGPRMARRRPVHVQLHRPPYGETLPGSAAA